MPRIERHTSALRATAILRALLCEVRGRRPLTCEDQYLSGLTEHTRHPGSRTSFQLNHLKGIIQCTRFSPWAGMWTIWLSPNPTKSNSGRIIERIRAACRFLYLDCRIPVCNHGSSLHSLESLPNSIREEENNRCVPGIQARKGEGQRKHVR
jgi:hypothetical protein